MDVSQAPSSPALPPPRTRRPRPPVRYMRLPRPPRRTLAATARYVRNIVAEEELDELEPAGLHSSERQRVFSRPYSVSERDKCAPGLVAAKLLDHGLPSIHQKNPDHVRRARRARLERIGTVDPDMPWEECPENFRRFAEAFPEGLSFAEIAKVLGMKHRQMAFKVLLRAFERLRAVLGDDVEERLVEILRTRDATDAPTPWEAIARSAA